MDTQTKKSFFKRFWWVILILILGIGFVVYSTIDRRDDLSKKSDKDKSSSMEFFWPDPNAKTITAVPFDLSKIKLFSKFRSCAGHDRSGYNFQKELESDRAMKHYYYPITEIQGTMDRFEVYAPFDGTVAMVQWVNSDSTEVRSDWLRKNGRIDKGEIQHIATSSRINPGNDIGFVSPLDENAVLNLNHLVFARDFQVGDKVKAGELIGYVSFGDKNNDGDLDYRAREYKPEDDKNIEVMDSIFNHMTPEVLAEFAKYGLTPENISFTKEERDAKPCGYDPVTKYGSTVCEESSADNDNQSAGRNNNCWIQLKLPTYEEMKNLN